MRAGAVDPVHARTAVALGQHGRALVGIQLRHGCPGVVTEHNTRAGVVGIHPHVVRIVRGVVGAARSGAALRRHNRLRTDDVEFSGTHVPAERAAGLPAVREDLDRHHAVEHIHPALPDDPRHHALDGHAVGDMHPPRPRLPEALRAVVAAVRRPAELDARRLQLLKHGPHVGVPAVAQHGWGPAVQRLGVELDQILGGIVRDAFLIEDRHIVVIPAADAAGAFQLALVHEEDAQPLLARAESRAAAGRTGADDEHVRFDERTERMN